MLELGEGSETVTVKESTVEVETVSSQLGDAITGTDVAALPLNGRSYTDLLSLQPGNSGRRFFSGPGIENYDLTARKNLRLTQTKSLEFRLELFNAFNHAQFYGPGSVDGNITRSTFGYVVSAAPPRLIQIGLKRCHFDV